jgi:hypothetical protein
MTPRKPERKGYVSLMATASTFGLAALATGLVAASTTYIRTLTSREALYLDRIEAESAAAQVLGRLSSGQAHPTPLAIFREDSSSREIVVRVSVTEGKYDLAADDRRTLVEALRERSLPDGLAERPESEGLSERARIIGLSNDQEDCLRSHFTLGRAPALHDASVSPEATLELERTVSVGDQVDLRVRINAPARSRVLWLRARFTRGGSWLLHDYRWLGEVPAEPCMNAS